MRYIAALPSIAILLGSALGLLLAEPPVLPAAIALTASAVSAFWCWRGGGGWMLTAFIAGAFLSGATLLSASAWQQAWRPPLRSAFEDLARAERAQAAAERRRLPIDDEASATIEGILRADGSPTENGVSLSVAVERVDGPVGREGQERSACGHVERGPVKPERGISERTRWGWGPSASGKKLACGGVIVTVVGELAAGRAGEWRAGRRVRMPAQLRPASRYLNPGVPDNERALARRGTTLVGTVKSGALVEVLARAGWWSEQLASARAFSRRAIADHVGRWSPRSAAIVSAIVIGDRSSLDPAVQRRLQEAGTYHVIAISGGNIAILAGLILAAFRVSGALGRTAMLAAIALLVVYAQFVGGGASVDRATLMAVVYFGARALDQRSPPLNAIAVVAAILVASNPLSVADPAFLLTFGATLAILVVVPRFHFSNCPRIVAALAAMLVASVAAEMLLLPIGATFFQRVTFAGLALNLLAIPLMAVAQIAGMVVVAAALVSAPAAHVAGWVADAGANGLIWSAELVRFVPGVTWRVATPAFTVCLFYYIALGWAWYGRRGTRARAIAVATACIAAAWLLVDPRTLLAKYGDGRLHVTFLDVGQGDAIFVVFPRGSTLLVDAGGLGATSAFDIGDRVVAPVIRAAGFRRLDRLALTHGDADHVGGALAVIDEFHPRDVFEGIPVPRSEPLAQLRTAALSARGGWSNIYAHHHLVVDGVDVTAWHPGVEDWERQKVRNDDSLVLEIRWRDVSIVLTGDIGREIERTLLTSIAPAPMRIVKIPHHGSLSSSSPEFVAALKPRIAVVSAGRNNHFGHPAPEVLGRYEAVGAEVFRTDRDGGVYVDTDGMNVDIQTFNGRAGTIVATTAFHENTKNTKGTK